MIGCIFLKTKWCYVAALPFECEMFNGPFTIDCLQTLADNAGCGHSIENYIPQLPTAIISQFNDWSYM